MEIECLGLCETGLVRKVNQDSIFLKLNDYAGIFVVADGMGGHSHGEIASQMITKTMEEWWNHFSEEKFDWDFEKMIQSIRGSLSYANREIYQNYNQNMVCGSTLAILFFYKDRYAVLHAGDSRVYLEDQGFGCITVDDVWQNQPGLKAEDKRDTSNPKYGHLTNALGIFDKLKICVQIGELGEGMVFLLCSDGLYKMCDEKLIQESLVHIQEHDSMQQKAQELKNEVYNNGARDNLAIVLVKLK